MIPATITTEVLEHADGRPIAYIDATAVAVFACQEPNGTCVIDIVTREDIPPGRLRVLCDGEPVGSLYRAECGESHVLPRRPHGRRRPSAPCPREVVTEGSAAVSNGG